MKKIQFIFLILFLTVSTTIYADKLWKDSVYGMSVDEVHKVIPDTFYTIEKSRLGNGSEELLSLNDIVIFNHKFKASFYFQGEKLTQVTLGLKEIMSFNSAMPIFENLTDAFRSKYGKEISREVDKDPTLSIAQSKWLFGRTNITLVEMSAVGGDAILNITYQERLAKEADNL